jgi:hypothetical protein
MATSRSLVWEVYKYGDCWHALAYIGASRKTAYSFTAWTRVGLELGLRIRNAHWRLRNHGA